PSSVTARSANAFVLRATRATLPPRAVRVRAVASPIPDEAPVTMNTRSSMRIGSPLFRRRQDREMVDQHGHHSCTVTARWLWSACATPDAPPLAHRTEVHGCAELAGAHARNSALSSAGRGCRQSQQREIERVGHGLVAGIVWMQVVAGIE